MSAHSPKEVRELEVQSVPEIRIGMLVPSSNTALEPATAFLAAPLSDRVGVHFSRFRVTRIALDTDADSQFQLEPILAAADLLADAKLSAIAWNGTSASWRGFDTDDRLCAELERRTGAKATSAIVSLNHALAAFGTKRLGLVTPYTADVEAAMIRNYAAAGIDIVATRRDDRTDNYSFADIPPDRVFQMCHEIAEEGVDAIAVVCTNMRGTYVAPRIEAEFNIPVLDSIAVTLWGALKLFDIDTTPLVPFGKLFTK